MFDNPGQGSRETLRRKRMEERLVRSRLSHLPSGVHGSDERTDTKPGRPRRGNLGDARIGHIFSSINASGCLSPLLWFCEEKQKLGLPFGCLKEGDESTPRTTPASRHGPTNGRVRY